MSDTLDRLRTALANQYTIEGELGSGGSAVVYLAQDLKHDRQVAVKVLRPELATALGSERFLREIKIAAKLRHPHILPLYDSGEAGGFLYYVMPYVEDESLRTKLAPEGRLSIAETIRILRDVVDALAHAHAQGVVHRDIKPDNVMMDQRHALVTDFGIGKALSAASSSKHSTTAGIALGTPSYMAPEQAAADPNIDHRADIYAVGALAYELLTGRPPFSKGSPQMVLSAHVTESPAPVTDLRPDVPPALAHLVMRSLEKKPSDRWQTASEMLGQLDTMATPSGGTEPTLSTPVKLGPPRALLAALGAAVLLVIAVTLVIVGSGGWGLEQAAGRPTVAVLPLRNLGPAEDDYFANGVTEAITTRLAGISQVGITSRQSANQYRDSPKTISQIAGELNVQYVVEGTIQRERPTDPMSLVRVTPQLIRASDDTHLWASSYDVDIMDAFRIYTDVAEEVARAIDTLVLQPSLGDDEPLVAGETEDMAVDTGSFEVMHDMARTSRLLRIALEALRSNRPNEAIYVLSRLDPMTGALEGWWFYWTSLALAHHMLGDHETEAETVRHGLEYYEAGNPGLLGSELSALAALGRVGEVDRLLDQVTTLEPTPRDAPRLPAGARQPPPSPRTRGPRVGPGWLFVQTAIELRGHGYDQASRAVLERLHRWADDRTPDEASEEGHRLAVATGLYLAERWDTAQASFEALAAASPRNPDLQGYLGTIAARRGDRAEALRISQWLEGPDLRGRSETRTLWRARIAALLGDPQLAMELLTDAFDEGLGFVGTRLAEGSRIVAVWLHTDMDLESLHDRADFQELLEPRG